MLPYPRAEHQSCGALWLLALFGPLHTGSSASLQSADPQALETREPKASQSPAARRDRRPARRHHARPRGATRACRLPLKEFVWKDRPKSVREVVRRGDRNEKEKKAIQDLSRN